MSVHWSVEKLPAGTQVLPSARVMKKGWDEPDRYDWPGEAIFFYFDRFCNKTVCQFLIFDRKQNQFLLKNWNINNLEFIET